MIVDVKVVWVKSLTIALSLTLVNYNIVAFPIT